MSMTLGKNPKPGFLNTEGRTGTFLNGTIKEYGTSITEMNTKYSNTRRPYKVRRGKLVGIGKRERR